MDRYGHNRPSTPTPTTAATDPHPYPAPPQPSSSSPVPPDGPANLVTLRLYYLLDPPPPPSPSHLRPHALQDVTTPSTTTNNTSSITSPKNFTSSATNPNPTQDPDPKSTWAPLPQNLVLGQALDGKVEVRLKRRCGRGGVQGSGYEGQNEQEEEENVRANVTVTVMVESPTKKNVVLKQAVLRFEKGLWVGIGGGEGKSECEDGEDGEGRASLRFTYNVKELGVHVFMVRAQVRTRPSSSPSSSSTTTSTHPPHSTDNDAASTHHTEKDDDAENLTYPIASQNDDHNDTETLATQTLTHHATSTSPFHVRTRTMKLAEGMVLLQVQIQSAVGGWAGGAVAGTDGGEGDGGRGGVGGGRERENGRGGWLVLERFGVVAVEGVKVNGVGVGGKAGGSQQLDDHDHALGGGGGKADAAVFKSNYMFPSDVRQYVFLLSSPPALLHHHPPHPNSHSHHTHPIPNQNPKNPESPLMTLGKLTLAYWTWKGERGTLKTADLVH